MRSRERGDDTVPTLKKKIPLVKLMMPALVLLMFIALEVYDLDAGNYMTLTLNRTCMFMVAMLAATPTVYTGVGFNYGITVGFVCGLAGAVIGISTGVTGPLLLLLCVLASIPIALIVGYAYGRLLNMVKGAEPVIATYVGYAFVSLGSIVWITLDVPNEALRFSNGAGIRVQVNLLDLCKDVLTNFLAIRIGSLVVPAGFILVCLAICLAFFVFMRSKTGMCMKICGNNPAFAAAIGLDIDHYRTISVVMSTVLAAVGIAFYAQTFGYYQFYSEYLTLGFSCIAGSLIGGASGNKVSVFNVIYGCFLYEAILTLSTPVVNKLMPGAALAEIVRVVVTNGIIVYALVKGGKQQYAK